MAYKFYLNGEKIQTIKLNNEDFNTEFNNETNRLVINSFTYDTANNKLTVSAKIVNVKLPNYYIGKNDFYLVPILYNELESGYYACKNRKNRKAGKPAYTPSDNKPRVHTSPRKYGVNGGNVDDFIINDYNNINITIDPPVGKTGNYLEYTYQNYSKKPNITYFYQVVGFYLASRPRTGVIPHFYMKEFKNQFRIEYQFQSN